MKKQLLKSALIAVAGVGLLAGSAMALPNGGSATSLTTILNNITEVTASNPTGNTTINVASGYLDDSVDSTWFITAGNQSSATFIIELAGWASTNKFGVYDTRANGTFSYVDLFGGVADDYDKVAFNINDLGDVTVTYGKYNAIGKLEWGTFAQIEAGFTGNSFGFYLDSTAKGEDGGLWHSDTKLNTDGKDHMLAYQGTGDTIKIGPWVAGQMTSVEYILAFEDVRSGRGADWDFDDMVLLIESVKPVPEPTTMLLFGTGLLGLAAAARRRKNS